MLSLDNKGQEFEPFRMLIGAVFAVLVLAIIVGAITYFDQLKLDISKQLFYKGLSNAVRQPNGDVLVLEDLVMEEASHSSSSIGRIMGLEEQCVELGASDSPSFTVTGVNLVKINKKILTNVYVMCITNESGVCASGCPTCCAVSFGEPPPA